MRLTRADLQGGVHVADAASVTVAAAAELWLARCESEGLELSTILQYKGHVRNHIGPLLGRQKLSRLTVPAIEAFRDELVNTRSKALSQKILTSLKALLKTRCGGPARQNVATQTRVKISGRHKTKIVIPAKDEIKGLLTESAELWPLTKFSSHTPARTAHRRRTVAAVDCDGGLFRHAAFRTARAHLGACSLPMDYQGSPAGRLPRRVGYPKSEAGNRDIPLPPMVINT